MFCKCFISHVTTFKTSFAEMFWEMGGASSQSSQCRVMASPRRDVIQAVFDPPAKMFCNIFANVLA